ncbi:MAG: hypothetical protein MUP30_02940 [Deltaproteobacteria bacterium]|nr:hypothetical protein [Deltaproteobacteria bacterium]
MAVIHEDEPVFAPVELLDCSQPFLLCGDAVISEQGVIVEQGGRDSQAAPGEPVLDGFIAEAVCCVGLGSEDLAKVSYVKWLKHCVTRAVEKSPSAAFLSSFVVATYVLVRLTPQDFEGLASGHF